MLLLNQDMHFDFKTIFSANFKIIYMQCRRCMELFFIRRRRLVLAQEVSCHIYDKAQNFMQHMHNNIQYMVDYLANLFVSLTKESHDLGVIFIFKLARLRLTDALKWAKLMYKIKN